MGKVGGCYPVKFQDVNVWAAIPKPTPAIDQFPFHSNQHPAANAKIRNLFIDGKKLTFH